MLGGLDKVSAVMSGAPDIIIGSAIARVRHASANLEWDFIFSSRRGLFDSFVDNPGFVRATPN
jgi:hypothetical protein